MLALREEWDRSIPSVCCRFQDHRNNITLYTRSYDTYPIEIVNIPILPSSAVIYAKFNHQR